jgi:hypothetical protein
MTISDWLKSACEDAERRGLPALKPLLEALAKATEVLRRAEWNDDATGRSRT